MDRELELKITLVAAEDDPAWNSDDYQTAIAEVYEALICQDPRTSSYMLVMESADSKALAYGVFGMVLAAAAPHLGKAFDAWFAAKAGRKVRLKVGDIEAEAHSVEDVEKLLDMAKAIKANDERKRLL